MRHFCTVQEDRNEGLSSSVEIKLAASAAESGAQDRLFANASIEKEGLGPDEQVRAEVFFL